MRKDPLPAVAAVVSFIDAINRGDMDRLDELMTEDHHLDVFDEAPLRGHDANVDVWRGYAAAFPLYVIYPERIVERDELVAVLGHTTGSHLGMPDADEMAIRVIWTAKVDGGKLAYWRLVEDSVEHRAEYGLGPG